MEEYIKVGIPSVDTEVIKKVVERLKEIGVLHLEDTQFVERSNIEDILPPIQVKNLLKYFADKAKEDATENSLIENEEEMFAPSACSSMIEKSTSSKNTESNSFTLPSSDDWLKKFQVPWQMFPKEALKACKENKLIKKTHQSEVVRILLNAILKIVPNPGRKQFRAVSKIVVAEYPASFQDRYENTVVAEGYATLMKKLEDAYDNKKRRNDVLENFSLNDSFQIKRRRKTIRNSYGCVNWQPKDFPEEETKESQKEKKEFLIQEFIKEIRQNHLIEDAMKKTFASQRFTINNFISIEKIKKEWPFLMEQQHFLNHYHELMGHDILSVFSQEIPKKGSKVFSFMKTKKDNRIREAAKTVQRWKDLMPSNSMVEVFGSIVLLMVYFNEEEDVLFQVHKASILF